MVITLPSLKITLADFATWHAYGRLDSFYVRLKRIGSTHKTDKKPKEKQTTWL